MNDTPGTPSAICVGHHPAKGERWVSPGVGERMIAYLRRTYAEPRPAERPKRAHLKLRADRPSTTTAPTVLVYPKARHCVDCGTAFMAANGSHRRCARCAREAKLAAHRRWDEKQQVVVRYPCERACVRCGVTITARTSRQVRCADCQHAYELEREQAQRDQRRGGTDHCRQCGAPLGAVHANLRFCSDACRRAHKAAYNAAYKAALRGGPHDG